MKQTREEALALLNENVKSESLRKHCLSVAFAMEAYAVKYNENREKWWVCGLLHDFDFERFPTTEFHPFEGVKILRANNYPEDLIEAILGHAEWSGVPRKSLMSRCLFAVDELCGFVMALAKVRSGNFEGMDDESVKKALKKKRFAEAISREDIEKGVVELGVSREEHFNLVVGALRKAAKDLGF